MSRIKYEVKIYNGNNELVDVQILSDERYDSLNNDNAYSLAKDKIDTTIPMDCHYRIKRVKNG